MSNQGSTTVSVDDVTYEVIETSPVILYRCGNCVARFADDLCFNLPPCDKINRTDGKSVIYQVKV